ncbi:S41 family peptidase [Paenibacillus sp. MBLB4367]|uniref:S41 family peptidase n=1 Tax=Paenibacillus sp. MBLB4367 TaxID=3384767 RepID=UPI003907E8AA
MKRQRYGFLRRMVVGALIAACLSASPAVLSAESMDSKAADRDLVQELIEKYHVSGLESEALAGKSVDEMLEKLNDPHTNYFTKEDYASFQSMLNRDFVGIGIQLEEVKEGLLIVEVYAGTEAEAAGIREGDIIVAVEGSRVAGQKYDELTGVLLGPENSVLNVEIEREGNRKAYAIKRKTIVLPVVTGQLFDGQTGYIKVATFSEDADERFQDELNKLKKAGMTSLIVDLRDNPGGLVDTAQNIAKAFIENGVLIHMLDRDKNDKPVFVEGGSALPLPVYFLVNEFSASASEVLTGFVQDYKLAKVIGKKTYGKGSVQSIFGLTSGGMLKLTIEQYLTPNYRVVDHKGLQPDTEVEGNLPQLIEALHQTGITEITLERTPTQVTIDRVKREELMSVVVENGKTYVPARVLAALIGGTVGWNAEYSSVDVKAAKAAASYTEKDRTLILKDGTGYIELGAFTRAFPQLAWGGEGERISIFARKAG